MAKNEQFDESVSRWLEEAAPARIPERVLHATFERTRKSGQNVGWRALLGRLSMPKFVPALGSAAAIVVVAALGLSFYANRQGGIGALPSPTPSASPTVTASPSVEPTAGASPSVEPTAPSPSPSATASPSTSPRPTLSPGFSRFTSSIHGISIDYPSGWQIREATEPWNHDAVAFGSPDVDVIFDPALQDDLYIALVSEPLNGQAVNDWCCGPLVERTEICRDQHGPGGAYTLGSARGWIQACGNDVAENHVVENHVVLVATATRGYIIQVHVGNAQLKETYDGNWFEALLKTVELR